MPRMHKCNRRGDPSKKYSCIRGIFYQLYKDRLPQGFETCEGLLLLIKSIQQAR